MIWFHRRLQDNSLEEIPTFQKPSKITTLYVLQSFFLLWVNSTMCDRTLAKSAQSLFKIWNLVITHWRFCAYRLRGGGGGGGFYTPPKNLGINWLFRNPASTIWREVFPTELLSHELRSTVSLSEFNGKVRYYIFWLKHGSLKMQL